ncbi:P subunit p21-like [Octopus vulgaris]|uniref:P subunit p21-like n=2 Tax=Octopus TaxID=6643 RepID=A0AA36F0A7_OCTVU|nr:ribonuclease P protein subunit p21 isoform X1 [Octopus sinensis]CAI9720891.1 P subunit p21-like [Octopus vulgaris]
MGKCDKGIPFKESFQRINFLYQAAYLTLTVNPQNTGLVRFYINTLKTIAQRQVLRLDPHLKRTICKRCFSLLVPGLTATIRSRRRREKHTVVTCLECGLVKRFLWRPDHQLWIDNPAAWLKMPSEVDNSTMTTTSSTPLEGAVANTSASVKDLSPHGISQKTETNSKTQESTSEINAETLNTGIS